MSYIFCEGHETPVATPVMEYELWQMRARNVGLSQRLIARLCGTSEVAVSAQLRGIWKSGTPEYVKTIIRSWEMLSTEQRAKLRAAVEANDDRL
jgi:hypothetical protein